MLIFHFVDLHALASELKLPCIFFNLQMKMECVNGMCNTMTS